MSVPKIINYTKKFFFLSLSLLLPLSSQTMADTGNFDIKNYPGAIKLFTTEDLYDCKACFESSTFKQASRDKKKEIVASYFLANKWGTFKDKEYWHLIALISKAIALPFIAAALPWILSPIYSEVFDYFMKVDNFEGPGVATSIKSFRRSSTPKLILIILGIANFVLNFFKSGIDPNSEYIQALIKINGVWRNGFILVPNDKDWYKYYYTITKVSFKPLYEKIIAILASLLILDKNPVPQGWMGRILFFFEPRIFVLWDYTQWFRKGLPRIVKSWQVVVGNHLPYDSCEKFQLHYIKEKYFIIELNENLAKSLEEHFHKVYRGEEQENNYTEDGITLFYATRPPSLELSKLSRQEVKKLTREAFSYYDNDVVRDFLSVVQTAARGAHQPPVLLKGVPGVGKTYAAKEILPKLFSLDSIAEVHLHGLGADGLQGTEKIKGAYESAIIKAGKKGPVAILLIDEFEKVLENSKYLVAFLKLFDTNNNYEFYSFYFKTSFPMIPINILTCNESVQNKALENRVFKINITGYTKKAKRHILYNTGALKAICQDLNIDISTLTKADYAAIDKIVEEDNDVGMRSIQHKIKYYIAENK